MKKVWVVIHHEPHEGSTLFAICATEELAKEYVEAYEWKWFTPDVEKWDLLSTSSSIEEAL
jgi:hypothetical protein